MLKKHDPKKEMEISHSILQPQASLSLSLKLLPACLPA
jgi:hypothetical protein